MLDGAEREWWETEDGDTSAPDVDIDPRFTCSICGERFIPTGKRHTKTCGAAKCAAQNSYRVERTNEQRYAKAQARWRKSVIEHGAYYNARASLRRRGLLTSETAAALLPLRGKGHIEVSAALAMCGLGSLARAPKTKRAATPETDLSISRDAWSLPSPTHNGPLMHAFRLVLSQHGQQRLRVRDYYGARLLHGALHRALGVGHDLDKTPFSLVLPSQRERALWMLTSDEDVITRLLAWESPRVILGDDREPHDLRIAERSRLRLPPPREPGQYRARVIASSPLVLKKSNRAIAKSEASTRHGLYRQQLQTKPTELVGSLEHVASRAGIRVDKHTVIARVILHDLDEIEGGIRVGGHWQSGPTRGHIACMVGVIDVECNAIGRWLLDCAALVGLGGKTAIGFGRVRVRDL